MAKKTVKTTKKVIKKPATYKGKSTKPGMGGSFAMLQDKLVSQGKSEESAGAIAASIGMKKFGKKQMATWSSQGKKRNK